MSQLVEVVMAMVVLKGGGAHMVADMRRELSELPLLGVFGGPGEKGKVG